MTNTSTQSRKKLMNKVLASFFMMFLVLSLSGCDTKLHSHSTPIAQQNSNGPQTSTQQITSNQITTNIQPNESQQNANTEEIDTERPLKPNEFRIDGLKVGDKINGLKVASIMAYSDVLKMKNV